MNKDDFTNYMSQHNDISKAEAKKIIDIFTGSVISAISDKLEISLIGFGNFSISAVPARQGRNPKTKEIISIPAYNQVRFKVGQKMKNAVN